MSKSLSLRKNPTMPTIKVTPIVKNLVGGTAILVGGLNCIRLFNKKTRESMKLTGTNIPLFLLSNVVVVAAGLILVSDNKGRK